MSNEDTPGPESSQNSGFRRAAEIVRARRLTLGYTQEELARHSEVSIRTVRYVEGSHPGSPRMDTLNRIAATLGLNADERSDLLAALGRDSGRPIVPPAQMLEYQADHADLLGVIGERMEHTSTVYAKVTASIGPDRRIVSDAYDYIVSANRPGVTGRPMVIESDTPAVVGRRVTGLENCTVRPMSEFVRGNIAVHEIEFTHELRRDESTAYSFRVDWELADESAVQELSAPTLSGDYAGRLSLLGVHHAARAVVVEVRFQENDLPDHCVQLFQRRIGSGLTVVTDVRIPTLAPAQIVLVDPKAGWHGIGWRWSS